QSYTQYIPLSVYDLKAWAGTPTIFVLDCCAAGILMNHFVQPPVAAPSPASSAGRPPSVASSPVGSGGGGGAPRGAGHPRSDLIVLAPCGAEEVLPTNVDLPADLFSSCLTTPMPIALRWFVRQNRVSVRRGGGGRGR
ncbi:unnamed protein product, partial [Laminaria digitata]